MEKIEKEVAMMVKGHYIVLLDIQIEADETGLHILPFEDIQKQLSRLADSIECEVEDLFPPDIATVKANMVLEDLWRE